MKEGWMQGVWVGGSEGMFGGELRRVYEKEAELWLKREVEG